MGLMETRVIDILERARLLNESQAWLRSITPYLEAKIVKDWIQNDQLLSQGIDENGQIIGLYSYASEIASGGRKQEGTPFTLYDEGEFFRSMFVQKLADSIIIDADYSKMEDQDWWKIEILGLENESLEKFIADVREGYATYVREVLGIN